jgi:hypothetical protein
LESMVVRLKLVLEELEARGTLATELRPLLALAR